MRLSDIPWDSARVPIINGYKPLYFNELILHDAMVFGSYVDFDRVHYWRIYPDYSQPVPDRYFTDGWKCRQCKTTFFGEFVSDLDHSCTGNLRTRTFTVDYKGPVC